MLEFSAKWLELIGITREAALADEWIQVQHPDDRLRVDAAWLHSVTTGEPYDIEHRVRFANGTYRWMRSRAYPRRDDERQIVRWYGTTEDINERAVAERRNVFPGAAR